MRRAIFAIVIGLAGLGAEAPELKLPVKPHSVRFALIGDSGTGDQPQFEIAKEMQTIRQRFPFDFVLMLGDNIYGGHSATDFKRKFEEPYQPLLDAGVKFFAALGNHDQTNERLYKPFNMDGKRFYSFKKGDAEFFALDSSYMDREQLDWLQTQLSNSKATWKICFLHHPLYSHARAHGSDLDLRARLEPVLEAQGVAVVFCGHEHVYERLKPQHGIYYFVLGSSGQLRFHDLRPSPDTAKGFDTERAFGLVEIAENQLYFQIVSRTGETVDSGTLELTKQKSAPAPGQP